MTGQRRFLFFTSLAAAAIFLISAFSAAAQEKPLAPELSVAGIKLGDRASGRQFLLKYLPTTGEDGRAHYYFYNKHATQVMKLVAASFDDPYMITEIEVFAVGQSYQKPHFVAENIGHFATEDRIFIGFQQSVVSMLIGPGVSRGDMIGPKDVIKKKGEPAARVKLEEGREAITYRFERLAIADEGSAIRQYDYTARYEFRKSKLKRFKLAIAPDADKKL